MSFASANFYYMFFIITVVYAMVDAHFQYPT